MVQKRSAARFTPKRYTVGATRGDRRPQKGHRKEITPILALSRPSSPRKRRKTGPSAHALKAA